MLLASFKDSYQDRYNNCENEINDRKRPLIVHGYLAIYDYSYFAVKLPRVLLSHPSLDSCTHETTTNSPTSAHQPGKWILQVFDAILFPFLPVEVSLFTAHERARAPGIAPLFIDAYYFIALGARIALFIFLLLLLLVFFSFITLSSFQPALYYAHTCSGRCAFTAPFFNSFADADAACSNVRALLSSFLSLLPLTV